MKTLLLSLALILPGAGDPFRDGLQHYAAGAYAKAVASFRTALEDDPDNARLNYNLALALWRIGAMDAAETAAEKAAALSGGLLDARRDGILGNIRYGQARAIADAKPSAPAPGGQPSPGPDLQKALELAGQARSHFQRGAVASQPMDPVLLRNLERAIRLEAELNKRIEEQEKQEQEQEQEDEDGEKQEEQNDDKKPDDDKKSDQQSTDDKKQDDKQDQDQQSDPDPKKDEPQPQKPEAGEDDKSPKPAPKPQHAPGEHDPDKELTPEQRRQLFKRLEQFEQNLQKLKAARKAARPKVKKDW